VADLNQHTLIADSGCNQTLVTQIWTILENTGQHVLMTGAFAGCNVGEQFPVVHATCKAVLEDGSAFALIANEAFYDSNEAQVKSLLSIHQSVEIHKVHRGNKWVDGLFDFDDLNKATR